MPLGSCLHNMLTFDFTTFIAHVSCLQLNLVDPHVVVEMCIDYCVRGGLWDACVKGANPYSSKQSMSIQRYHCLLIGT